MHNNLKAEQEDRIRLAEDVRYKFELKGKMEGDSNKAEKDGIKESYKELDQIIKSHITHQADTLRNMENNFDTQLKTMQAAIRKEEISRAQQELLLKSDITKLAEQLRTDYELFKSQQAQLTEKITEMIKLEVEARLQGEKDSRNVTEAVFQKFVDDMTTFRDAVEKQNKRFAKDLKEVSTESSERSNFLSRYIEDLVKKAEENFDSQLAKMKMLCAKLTESVKEHVQSNEKTFGEFKQNIENMQTLLHESMETLRNEAEIKENDMGIKTEMEYSLTKLEFENLYKSLDNYSNTQSNWKSHVEETLCKINQAITKNEEKCVLRNQEQNTKNDEQIDRKSKALLESLKKANQEIWEHSIKLSEKQFSREGVKEILEIVPPQVLKMPDIKNAIGELTLEKGKNPRPVVKMPEFPKPKEVKKDQSAKDISDTPANQQHNEEKKENLSVNEKLDESKKTEVKKDEKKTDLSKSVDKSQSEKQAPIKEEKKIEPSEAKPAAPATKPPAKEEKKQAAPASKPPAKEEKKQSTSPPPAPAKPIKEEKKQANSPPPAPAKSLKEEKKDTQPVIQPAPPMPKPTEKSTAKEEKKQVVQAPSQKPPAKEEKKQSSPPPAPAKPVKEEKKQPSPPAAKPETKKQAKK